MEDMELEFDVRHVPFSRRGSYMAMSVLRAKPASGMPEGLYLRHLRAGGKGPVFIVEPLLDGEPVAYTIRATPSTLRIDAPGGCAEFCFPSPGTVRFRAEGIGLRFSMAGGSYNHVTPIPGCSWEVNSYTHGRRFLLTPVLGELSIDAPWTGLKCERIQATFRAGKPGLSCQSGSEATRSKTSRSEENVLEGIIEEYAVMKERPVAVQSWEESVCSVKRDFDQWLSCCPEPDWRALGGDGEAYRQGHGLAAYITWSCMVDAEGFLTRPAMYMSKNWMANIWSWDHCFNAMALVYNNPALAWDQFCIFFDRQHPSGVLPDYMNDKGAVWNCCKPPIHGLTLRWMMARTDYITKERLQEVYSPLSRWTEWWFRHRDNDADGIPQYNHGNDSGWDNSTVFLQGVPVESPDLAALLVVQMDVLAEVAGILGKAQESKRWQERSEDLLKAMMGHFWNGTRLVPVLTDPHHPQGSDGSHRPVQCESLLPYVSLVLGKRLPEDVLNGLVQGLTEPGAFLTRHGLATESLKSPYHKTDGYWLGPIWAPSTMLIVEGLRSSGHEELARDIARRFCHMAACTGMAENFDPLTGQGLQDRAFTWTSSVYMILAHEYC